MLGDFDAVALFEALDERRQSLGLSWRGVAGQLWNRSAELNARRDDHPIDPSTITGMSHRRATSCQHALFMLRWLGVPPERFVPGAAGGPLEATLPGAGPDRRLRWDLAALHAALAAERRDRDLSWAALAALLHCTPNQLTGLRTARFGADMRVTMRLTGWLGRPSADFVVVAKW